MNQWFENADLNEAAEELIQKYYNKSRQVPLSEDFSPGTSHAAQRLVLMDGNKHSNNSSSEALQDLFEAVSINPHHNSENLRGDSPTVALQDSLLFTETDVTLPSCLDGSRDSLETERDQMLQGPHHVSRFRGSSSLELTKVYQEMTTVCEQLKAARQSQQEWERILCERERRLKQQEEALGMLNGLEQMVHTHVAAIEERHQRELSRLQELIREKSRENKRLKSSFNTIKELNDNLKTQLNKISEQKTTLESESKRVWARLENLQRKYEHSTASKDLQKVIPKSSESNKADKKEKTAADAVRRRGQKRHLNPSPKLLMLLMDWVLDVQTLSPEKTKVVVQCLPPEAQLSERCIKVLPLLADQLHQTPSSEPGLLLNLLRLIYWALRHLDNITHHVPLSATLRRIGEEASKPASQCVTSQSEDPHLPIETSGCLRTWPLYRSPCPHTRILSTLIILRTITQADVLALTLDNLRTGLMCEESRGLYIHYEGVPMLLSLIRANRVGLHMPIDILMQLTQHSRFLNPFLEACSCEEFFKTASQMLKNARLELSSLEKFSILLQKLSGIRKNRHLFELSSLHLQIQELHQKTNPTHTFLCVNLRSILLNLK